jgi:hypothetical protein
VFNFEHRLGAEKKTQSVEGLARFDLDQDVTPLSHKDFM